MKEKTIKILEEPLNQKSIKYRKEGYGQVGYIEGEHSIREANRAFDFDWSYEIKDMTMVQNEQKEKKKKQPNDPIIMLNYIGFTSIVKVTVGDITKEGIGFGQGIDRDLGKAFESATKEAETDALKRALRSFGNIFGLALYTKDSVNITSQNKETYQVISDENIEKLETLINKKGADKKALMEHFDVLRLTELTEVKYNSAIAMLNKKKDKEDDKAV